MDRRLPLAIVLMIAVMVLSNVLFPPMERPVADPSAPEGVPVAPVEGEPAAPVAPAQDPEALPQLEEAELAARRLAEAGEAEPPAVAAPVPEDRTVTVRSDLYEYRFDTRGARLVGATMLDYEDYSEDGGEGERVELLRPGDAVLGYRVTAAGSDTVSLDAIVFTPSATLIEVGDEPAELTFEARLRDSPLTFEVRYRFVPDGYRVRAEGGLQGLGDRGYTVLVGLGRGLEWNEAVRREDEAAMGLVTRDRTTRNIATERLDRLAAGESRAVAGGPFSWAASKSKYWLVALVAPEDRPGFGGVVMRGVEEDHAAQMEVNVPVPAGSDGFEYLSYLGPQDFGRLRAIGQELHNVNPFGWRWLRWFIRPFGNLMVAVLIWMHQSFSMAYGWVLILFGVVSRVILFPLYQISMRQQMKQMALQPEMKKLQERYKEDPPKLQQEMMKLYKEHGVNPLGGCVPMLLPFPILITLFFVFQNTIEFRGVPFLWIPDLSLKDPIYLIPLLMGGSMLLLNWIGQRGMETNSQMKIMTYVLPVVFTFMFAQFAAGLNMYYAASNIASLPQQMYLARERRRARPGGSGAGGEPSPGHGEGEGGESGKEKPKRTRKKGPGRSRQRT